ncbi:DUF5133 domain-containing protein [Streptomyces sp. NPDC059445]|uniref:DUF5133 domain-containing protein n=1 Tax=unclassified Streptomyces TaxID=2593676 RepID=UPI0036981ABF
MLLAHPVVLTRLIERCETLRILRAENGGSPEVRRRMDGIAYTLCVSTGPRDIDTALIAARRRLPGARPYEVSLVTL